MSVKFALGTLAVSFYLAWVGSGRALGGGYIIPHQTAKAVALSNAVTAGIDDPSAVYVNPAGLTEIESDQVMGGLNYASFVSNVKNSGRKSVNLHDDNFIPNLFANYHIPDTYLTVGLGTYAPFGLATSYSDKSFTRFAAVRSELRTLFITPALAWRASRYLSLGGGVSFVHSSAVLSRAVFLGAEGFGEGRLRITDTDNAYGYNLGLILRPDENVKVGFTYRSRVDLNFDTADVKFQDAAITGGFLTEAKGKGIHLPLPPFVSTGVHWQTTIRWGIEVVYDYVRWSEFKSLKARFSPALPALGGFVPISSLSIPQDWKDRGTIRLGTSYRLNENLELRGGIAAEKSPVPSRTLSPAIPSADILTLNGGIGYKMKNVSLDFGYMPVFYKTRKVTSDVLETGGNPDALPFPGTPGPDKYETINHFVSLHLIYRF